MKFLLVLATLVLSTVAIDQGFLEAARKKVRGKVEECINEEHATAADLDTILGLKIPESHEGKCVFFCAHKKFNIQNDDGTFNKAGAMETVEILKDIDDDYYKKWVEVVETCGSTPAESDPCLFSVSLFQCVIKQAQSEGIHDVIIE